MKSKRTWLAILLAILVYAFGVYVCFIVQIQEVLLHDGWQLKNTLYCVLVPLPALVTPFYFLWKKQPKR